MTRKPQPGKEYTTRPQTVTVWTSTRYVVYFHDADGELCALGRTEFNQRFEPKRNQMLYHGSTCACQHHYTHHTIGSSMCSVPKCDCMSFDLAADES